ncbi:MAG: UvrD-helicase domain-containing protein [Verrucomicrobia bacterium]|jgi:DNA helicase-2/ATP-dependent DNA helicase PcrA|nr:UvrD-helicase domain-containing protein [Verrucomicrobiota bacterium]
MQPALSSKQREVVEAPDGPYLVVASAGSGKTRILTARIRHLLLERKIRSRVLALTFTNKAAAEMKERLVDIPDLGERAYIGTIHSFCQSVLEAYGNLIGFAQAPAILERDNDRIALLEEVYLNNPELRQQLERYPNANKKRGYLYTMLQKISSWKREWELYTQLKESDWPNRHELMLFQDYEERLAQQGAIEFDDILLLAYRILSERPKVARIYQRSYRYFCVDEAQDLNAVQYGIIRLLAQDSKNLLMVGDPNQAIYGFNGSSSRFMADFFVKDFSATKIILRENFRSSRAVIRAANALYPQSIDETNLALPGTLQVAACETEVAEAEWIADHIQALLQRSEIEGIDGPPDWHHFAVLARNRFIFKALEKELADRKLPYHIRQPAGGGLESEWGRVFDLGLRILGNPENSLYLAELHKRLDLPKDLKLDAGEGLLPVLELCVPALPEKWAALFPEMIEAWKELEGEVNRFRSVLNTLEDSLKSAALKTQDEVRLEELERALSDIGLLHQLWKNYTREVAADSRSVNHFRNQSAMGALNPHAEGAGITLATIHAVKGLEYPVVFVMGLAEGVMPDYRAIRNGPAALAEEKTMPSLQSHDPKGCSSCLGRVYVLCRGMMKGQASNSDPAFLNAILERVGISDAPAIAVAEDE